jgi:hypothetical protein
VAKQNQPNASEVLAALDSRVAELKARDGMLLDEQLALEAAKVEPLPPSPIPANGKIDIGKYLDVGALEPTNDKSAGARLYAILREREAIKAATELAGQRAFRLRVTSEAELAGDIHDRAHKNIAKSVQAVRVLRDLAQERKRLRDEYASRVGLDLQIPAGVAADRFCGAGVFADTAQSFIDAARRAGVE